MLAPAPQPATFHFPQFTMNKPVPGAILVNLDFGNADLADRRDEFVLLAQSAGAEVRQVIEGRRQRPDPAFFAGTGKVEEIAAAVRTHAASLVLFNHELSPGQQRNIEQKVNAQTATDLDAGAEIDCRVLDRSTLILDIFAQRAQSHEGKLQVELAQLEHLSTRLVRGWTHLERQKGGIGLRGPGETQLETDRRLLSDRVKSLKDKLEKVQKQRTVQRRARARGQVMSISIVGYTNAGKSTLFNALTHAGAYAADQLFATLDTTSRKLYLPGAGSVVISDTVGFIRDLPHTLVAAFRATLEETVHADILLHVIDAANPARDEQVLEVNKVLHEIQADAIPQILLLNKIDLTAMKAGGERDEYGRISRVYVSAKTGDGIDLLREALTEAAAARHSDASAAVQ
jgi:GTP-binding protein HflX